MASYELRGADSGSVRRLAVNLIQQELMLPCGVVIPNRLAKAAMTEGLADAYNCATEAHVALYERWAANDLGLMLTGNIQIDREHLERPGNIAIDDGQDLGSLETLARAGTARGNHFWAQLNHPGRQTPMAINSHPQAPSSISLPLMEAACGQAREMGDDEIEAVIVRFASAARVCRDVGFTGVQIHAAHGYLISQFLSPLSNVRTDRWGGSLENRSRLLIDTIRAVRLAVGADFPVSVKLNSADFQRGGFTEQESVEVASWLDAERIDLLEISGGNYEQMEMVGLGDGQGGRVKKAASTVAREAYFIDYARRIRPLFRNPLMITGGMRSADTMNAALASGECDVIGVGRPMCAFPDITGALLRGEIAELPAIETRLAMRREALGPDVDDAMFKRVESFALLGWYCNQVMRVGKRHNPDLEMDVFDALIAYKKNEDMAAATWARPHNV